MIIDHRTYTVAHGRMAEYLERYRTMALPVQLRHLGRLIGFYVSDIGPLNQVVHIWAYEDIADREARRARMAADPEWKAFQLANAGIFVQQDNKIMKPTVFSP
ncbi:NIPSNAP family protein [Acidisoma cellulosilytica]|uniref:NIPSNAP family protein n=1 Tax=Acidisoma cellulosilyticum TaxID=2802395 RepID=A0A963Z5U5_9PROT|nr:NIPSNAP family protein [Acidisoma cellulosilyticum]MCB8883086.1 NIPSNAP family protein [Acidisoma cellulosilyticum]